MPGFRRESSFQGLHGVVYSVVEHAQDQERCDAWNHVQVYFLFSLYFGLGRIRYLLSIHVNMVYCFFIQFVSLRTREGAIL